MLFITYLDKNDVKHKYRDSGLTAPEIHDSLNLTVSRATVLYLDGALV